jgi:molecular chaperone HscB
MTHFELYGLPVSLFVDAGMAKQKFYELSRMHHPDFFTNADQEEQDLALDRSAQVNRAFKIFSNREETIKYALQLKGLLEEEEKYALPQDFLMEMLELNEEVMEAKMDSDKEGTARIVKRIDHSSNELYEPVRKIVEGYQEGITSEEELLQVKEYYYKKKYLDRILAGIR